MVVASVADLSVHPIIHCNDAGFIPRIILTIQTSYILLLCLGEGSPHKEVPRMLFSESVVMHVFVQKDWNFLALQMGTSFLIAQLSHYSTLCNLQVSIL